MAALVHTLAATELMSVLNAGRDLRFAVRSLRKSPGFTAVAVLTLALGVGANTAVFSLMNAVLLRPLPYHDPDSLVLIWESAPFFGLRDSPVAPANYVDWRARSRSFAEVGALEDHGYSLTGDGTPEVVSGAFATASLFRALGTRPVLGRTFREEEDRPGAQPVAVLSYAFWTRRFAADRSILARDVVLNNVPHKIIGVLAPGAEPPSEYTGSVSEVWTPFGSSYSAADMADRGRHNWMVVARLKPGVSLQAANSEMDAIGAALAREYPKTNEQVGAFVAPLRDHFVSSSRRVILILLGTVAMVLLIACANLANLFLCRAAGRTREVAIRGALGAGTVQLARQALCESMLLSFAGSALGLFFAVSTFRFLGHLAPGALTGLNELTIDWRVLGFTLLLAVGTALVFAMVPLVQLRRVDIGHALKQGAHTVTAAAGSRRFRSVLICTETALAFMLLIGAGLLLQTFARLRGVNPGFRTDHLLTLRLPRSLTSAGFGDDVAFQREVVRRVTAIPGVASAGFANHIPLAFKGDITGVGAEGRDVKERFQCNSRVAGPGYFRTMGIPVRRGRDVDERDGVGSPYGVWINETLANLAWPWQDPLGRRILFGDHTWVPVVGVVGNVRSSGLDASAQPEFYVSALQAGFPPDSLAIRTNTDPGPIADAVRRTIWSLRREQPVTDVATMEDILDREVFQRRVQLVLSGAFAILALVLASIGLYGVLSYVVGQQTQEIGMRLALGALPSTILRHVLAQGLTLAVIGVAIGIAGALAASRLIAALLFGIEPTDPATYAGVAALLLATAVVATLVPARRAMRVDPIIALREE